MSAVISGLDCSLINLAVIIAFRNPRAPVRKQTSVAYPVHAYCKHTASPGGFGVVGMAYDNLVVQEQAIGNINISLVSFLIFLEEAKKCGLDKNLKETVLSSKF